MGNLTVLEQPLSALIMFAIKRLSILLKDVMFGLLIELSKGLMNSRTNSTKVFRNLSYCSKITTNKSMIN